MKYMNLVLNTQCKSEVESLIPR